MRERKDVINAEIAEITELIISAISAISALNLCLRVLGATMHRNEK
jgi:hypothetical protein